MMSLSIVVFEVAQGSWQFRLLNCQVQQNGNVLLQPIQRIRWFDSGKSLYYASAAGISDRSFLGERYAGHSCHS